MRFGPFVASSDCTEARTEPNPEWQRARKRFAEQARVVQLLVARVDYDGAKGKVAITFHQTGLRGFVEFADRQLEKIA